MPYLYDFEFLRLGASSGNLTSTEKLINLINKEIEYPSNYELMNTDQYKIPFKEYIKWLITLIIPKEIVNIKNIVTINYVYSEKLFGIAYQGESFSVALPSLLGEGILLYGSSFSFIHAILLAIVSSFFVCIYSDNQFSLWNLYIIIQMAIMPRGGSQGPISLVINSSVLVILCSIFQNIKNCKYRGNSLYEGIN